MQEAPIIIERTYNAPIDKVWKALTDKDQICQWYFNIPDFKAEPGFEFEFIGKGKDGTGYLHKCKITIVIPPFKLAHSWRYDGYEGNSLVSFELKADGDKTHLTLTHSGFESFPAIAAFAKESFVEGWTYITGTSLKKFVEA
jgi:uncharacterized protein YndB with AHSA1/START domain